MSKKEEIKRMNSKKSRQSNLQPQAAHISELRVLQQALLSAPTERRLCQVDPEMT
jgi:hypothetical protein